jgi:signal transduction histidine kinase
MSKLIKICILLLFLTTITQLSKFYVAEAQIQTLSSDIEELKLNFSFIQTTIEDKSFFENKNIEWRKYESPKFDSKLSLPEYKIVLKSEFKVENFSNDSAYYLFNGPIEYYCKVYLNGNFIFQRGFNYDGFNNRLHRAGYNIIPPDLLKTNDSVNILIVELYNKNKSIKTFGGFTVTNLKNAAKKTFYQNFLNVGITQTTFIIGHILFIFFLMVFFRKNSNKDYRYLYFAIIALTFGYAYTNNVFSYDAVNLFVIEKISRIAIPLMMLANLQFLISFTGIWKENKKFRVLISIPFTIFIIIFLISTDNQKLEDWYKVYSLYVSFPALIIYLILPIISTFKKFSWSNVTVVLGYSLVFLSALYDVIFFLQGIRPYIQLTPLSYFCILILLFLILAREHGAALNELIISKNKLRGANKQMEQEIIERTKELSVSNMRLSVMVKELNDKNRIKDNFFSIIAHDIKNPLNQIIGLADIIKIEHKEFDEEKLEEYLGLIQEASVNLYQLLENLLEWAKSQSGKKEFNPKTLNALYLLQDVIDLLELQAEEKRIKLNIISDGNPMVFADENMLKSILRNLIGNAIKYSNQNGEINIYIKYYESFTEFTVEDFGIGISEDKQSKIFRIGEKKSTDGTKGEKGTGLGLILCKEFVTKHYGEISVISTPGTGSTFIIRLPHDI